MRFLKLVFRGSFNFVRFQKINFQKIFSGWKPNRVMIYDPPSADKFFNLRRAEWGKGVSGILNSCIYTSN